MERPQKTPIWYLKLHIPNRLRARLNSVFTPHRDGWVCWYRGQTRFVCGKTTPPEEVEAAWEKKRAEIDGIVARPARTGSFYTVKMLCSDYIMRLRQCVETGRPKRLSEFTLMDYISGLRKFAKCVGEDNLVDEMGPDEFNKYADSLSEISASSASVEISYVHAMFRWAHKAGKCSAPSFGPDFVKPSQQQKRDERLSSDLRYTIDELHKLWIAATEDERLWICLGLCSLDNSDLANLTAGEIDFKNATIDYRRRKVGLVRRVIPIIPALMRRLKDYMPEHPHHRFVLCTPEGNKLVRAVASSKRPGQSNPVDYISMRWTKLMQRAGLRPKNQRAKKPDGNGRRPLKWNAKGDGRGFRSLRTTFANLVPPGFSDERKIIMGHSHGDTFLENYLETVGLGRLREAMNEVWLQIFTSSLPLDQSDEKKTPSASLKHQRG